ncbi:MAG: hypothetical protein IT580_22835 [Verrucomicrobiales bacterium]|nr:hypothetical protein [Verrucomicrobiales bacterium]
MSRRALGWVRAVECLLLIVLGATSYPARGVGLVVLTNAMPTGLSGDGRFVIGQAGLRTGETPQPFVWSLGGGMQVLTNDLVRAETRTYAPAISYNGHAVFWVTADPPHQGYRWTPDRGIEDLGWGTRVREMTLQPRLVVLDAGETLVISRVSMTLGEPPRAHRWTAATGIRILPELFEVWGASADSRVLLGRYASWSETLGLLRLGTGNPIQDLPKHQDVNVRWAWAANDAWSWLSPDGQIVVGYDGTSPWRWTVRSGKWDLIPVPEDHRTVVLGGIADGATLVGQDISGIGALSRSAAVLWRDGRGWRDMRKELKAGGINTSGWQFERCSAISSDGKVLIGTGQRSFSESNEVLGWIAILDDSYQEPSFVATPVKPRRAEVYEFSTRRGVHYQRQERIAQDTWIPVGGDLIGDGTLRRFYRPVGETVEHPEFRYVELP